MQLDTILLGLAALSTTSAAPSTWKSSRWTPVIRDLPPPPSSWTVSNYKEGCSPGGCSYGFNVTLNNNATTEQSFSTYCAGTDVAYTMQPCQDKSIMSNEVSGLSNVTLVIQHVYSTSGGATYNITGNHTIVIDGTPIPQNFTIRNFEVKAVA